MSTDLAGNALWVVTVGGPSNLYYKSDNNGALNATAQWPAWGGTVRHEPFTLQIWNGGIQVYYIDYASGNVMAKYGTITSPPNATDGIANLGGVVCGSPVAVYYDQGNKRIEVFAIGMDGTWWGCYYSGSKWNWEHLPLSPGRSPTFRPEKIYASTDGNRRIDLVGVATTNDLYHRFYNGKVWSSWVSVGKNVVGSRPLCFTMSPTRVDIVAQDAGDQKLYHTAIDGGVFLGWEKIDDNQMIYDVAGDYFFDGSDGMMGTKASFSSSGRFDIAYVDVKGATWHNTCFPGSGTLGTWRGGSGSESYGGVATSGPKVTSRTGGKLDVFVRGTDNAIWWQQWDGAKYVGWKNIAAYSVTKPC